MRTTTLAATVLVGLALAAPAGAAVPGLHVQTSISPRPAYFGDLVNAYVDVVVDGAGIDAGSVRVTASFGTWQQAQPVRTSTAAANGLVRRSFRYRLSCLDSTCLPGAKMRSITLPTVQVSARLRSGQTVSVRRAWPALEVTGRVSPDQAAAAKPPFRPQTALPAPRYRVTPTPLALWLDVLAAVLALAAAGLVAAELVRRRRLRGVVVDDRPPLVRALALVREAEGRPPDDRRKAAGLLARTLEQSGGNGLADAAARVAWSGEHPSADRLEQLADDVERGLEP